jgi:hypothetical protein
VPGKTLANCGSHQGITGFRMLTGMILIPIHSDSQRLVKDLCTLNVKMMNRKFVQLTMNDLLEKLSDCTLRYSRMHVAGGREQDFYRVKKDILDLQQEIVRRKEEEDSNRKFPSSDRNSSN